MAMTRKSELVLSDAAKVSRLSMLERLPLEVIGIIHLYLGLQSFHAAITTCRRLYDAFLCNRIPIVANFFYGTIPKSVRRHARLTHECPVIAPFNRSRVKGFISRCIKHRSLQRHYSLDDMMEMIKLQIAVRQLADAIIQQCARANDDFHRSLLKRGVSLAERDRLFRALYCFETLSRLLQPGSYESGLLSKISFQLQEYLVEVGTLFLKFFSPVENAQLGCVHDLLVECLIPVFDEIRFCDVELGGYPFPHRLCGKPKIQYIMSLGLWNVLRYIKAETREQRALIVQHPPRSHYYFIEHILEEISQAGSRISYRPGTKGFYDDTDQGPELAFDWVQFPSQPSTRCIYREEDRVHRQWGYVLWDEQRHGYLHLGVSGGPATYASIWKIPRSFSESTLPERRMRSFEKLARSSERDVRGRDDRDGEAELVYVRRPGFGGGWFGGLVARFLRFMGAN